MGSRMKRLAVICARGGSKGIKNKNLRLLSGKPLLTHTIQQAEASGIFNWVAVSSDSTEIRTAGLASGSAERPPILAKDTAQLRSLDDIQNAVQKL